MDHCDNWRTNHPCRPDLSRNIALNQVGAAIWALLEVPRTVESIAASLSEQFRVDLAESRSASLEFLGALREAGACTTESPDAMNPEHLPRPSTSERAAAADSLARAIQNGAVIENPDGALQLPESDTPSLHWISVKHGPALDCEFLMHFMFRHIYAESAVPNGCSACYKVKIVPKTLRQLVAAWEIGKRIPCRSKWGVDLDNPLSQGIYAGYFYTEGLGAAEALCRGLRGIIDADPLLGPSITMSIKRGCSEYEAASGLPTYTRSRLSAQSLNGS